VQERVVFISVGGAVHSFTQVVIMRVIGSVIGFSVGGDVHSFDQVEFPLLVWLPISSCCCLRRFVQVELLSGSCEGELMCVPRINFSAADNTDGTIGFTRRQFPLRLAFCMTINKSQGQTFRPRFFFG
jgi:hypothetical protein